MAVGFAGGRTSCSSHRGLSKYIPVLHPYIPFQSRFYQPGLSIERVLVILRRKGGFGPRAQSSELRAQCGRDTLPGREHLPTKRTLRHRLNMPF